MTLRITFSYDCEGNWGFVDWDEPPLSDKQVGALGAGYERLLDLHLSYEAPATFAFVSLFAMPESDRADYIRSQAPHLIGQLPTGDINTGCWDGHQCFEAVRAAATQSDVVRIGSPSLTPLPFLAHSKSDQITEMVESQRILQDLAGGPVETFVYPRNEMDVRDECRTIYRAYRDTPANSTLTRGYELVRTATGLEYEESVTSDYVFASVGARSRFSDSGWRRCWQRRLAKKSSRDRTIHVWSHPHDLIRDPGVGDRIEWLLELMRTHEDRVELVHITQTTPS